MNNYTRMFRSGLKPAIVISLLALNCFMKEIEAQDNSQVLPGIKLSGFVKSDFFLDTRQTISAREGHFLLFPAPRAYDGDMKDINTKANFNFMPIHSNLAVNITGPSALGATTSGLIEGDFFGQSNVDVNMLRLRHAFIKLKWANTELLIGQYWHPLFVVSCFPGTVSFNTGAPIQPFSRAPQVRITHYIDFLKISGALLSQRDNASVGPEGTNSKYLRDSGIPEIQLSGEVNIKNNREFVFGAGFGYKKLTPMTKTGKNYKTSETVSGISVNAYLKLVGRYLTMKLEGVYLENGSEFLSISGYAVKDTIDTEKALVNFEPVRTASCWADITTNGKSLQFGIFSGYTENLGTRSVVSGPFYLTSNLPIKSLFRVSPRIVLKSDNVTVAAEIEYTSALYGTINNHCVMVNTSNAENIRFLISVVYKF